MPARNVRAVTAVSSTGEARRARGQVAALLAALRPAEWTKNLFVFPTLVFSGAFDETSAVVRTTGTFVAFCAISSAGYLLNDLRDVELDRAHPTKRFRPIASGELSERPPPGSPSCSRCSGSRSPS